MLRVAARVAAGIVNKLFALTTCVSAPEIEFVIVTMAVA
jgi:hypothetical protein